MTQVSYYLSAVIGNILPQIRIICTCTHHGTRISKSMNPSLGTWIFTSWHMAWYQWIMDADVYLNVAFENIQQLWCYEWFIHVCYFLIYRGVMKPYGFIMSTKYYWHVMEGLALLLWSNLKGINTSTYPREYSLRYNWFIQWYLARISPNTKCA